MKTIGLIGGMSWESTRAYYEIINQTVKERLGGLHSAKLLLYSMDFAELEPYQTRSEWDRASAMLTDAAQRLETAGADFLVLCSNTAHKIAPEISAAVSIPLLHIADAAVQAVQAAGVESVGLLGTRYTMTESFYTSVLERAGLRVLIPEEAEIDAIHRVIFDELCLGVVREPSAQLLQTVIERLCARGAQGIVLGCTELNMLLKPEDAAVPMFDTTLLHARQAALQSI